MTITLYKNSAEKNRVDKTNYLTQVRVMTGTLKSECGIVAPIITLQLDNFPSFNYVKINEFNRYYFVNKIKSITNNLWEIYLGVDVLFTYRQAIMQLQCYIDRCELRYNPYIVDDLVSVEIKPEIEIQEIPLLDSDDDEIELFRITEPLSVIISAFSMGVYDD